MTQHAGVRADSLSDTVIDSGNSDTPLLSWPKSYYSLNVSSFVSGAISICDRRRVVTPRASVFTYLRVIAMPYRARLVLLLHIPNAHTENV